MSNTPDRSRLPYRPCVGVMLFNASGQVFVGQRIDTEVEAWQMPQGGIDEGESPLDAAVRELGEEIGTTAVALLEECPEWLTYDLPDELVGKVWGGRYRGQIQKWFAFRFVGRDKDINLDTEHPEFAAWQWLELDRLADVIVPFKRPIYAHLVETFAHLAIRA